MMKELKLKVEQIAKEIRENSNPVVSEDDLWNLVELAMRVQQRICGGKN